VLYLSEFEFWLHLNSNTVYIGYQRYISCHPWYIVQFTAKQHLQFACNRGRYINVIVLYFIGMKYGVDELGRLLHTNFHPNLCRGAVWDFETVSFMQFENIKAYPLCSSYEIFKVCGHWAVQWPVHVLNLVRFAQGIQRLREFNLGVCLLSKVSAPSSGETLHQIRTEKVLEAKNGTDLLYHRAQYGGFWTES